MNTVVRGIACHHFFLPNTLQLTSRRWDEQDSYNLWIFRKPRKHGVFRLFVLFNKYVPCPWILSLEITAFILINGSYLTETYPHVVKQLQRHIGNTSEDEMVFQSPTYFICLLIKFLDAGERKYLLFPMDIDSEMLGILMTEISPLSHLITHMYIPVEGYP